MIEPTTVHIIHHRDRTYATDRYVLVDCTYVKDDVPEPGVYEIKATRPATLTRLPDLADPQRMVQRLLDAIEYYDQHPERHHQITWSAWARHHENSRSPVRIGAMGDTPVAFNHDLVARLPPKYQFFGHESNNAFLIGLDRGAQAPHFIALAMPIRLDGKVFDPPVQAAIVGSLHGAVNA